MVAVTRNDNFLIKLFPKDGPKLKNIIRLANFGPILVALMSNKVK